ncbi:PREDICTED: uncharacterized protein LOC107064732 [Polistes dominula]|uniref:Uncharacterized protein LOC107064732 n=1 Tax=Polistes dominula TaxID=743375 RepID=A0ABM1HZ41_POLDO|nr:PREDICTED: uncharacterized protein LOC107064732 [Polistes dominula]
MKTKVIILLQLLTIVLGNPQRISNDDDNVEHLEMKLTKAMDALNEKDNIDIYGNIVTLQKVAVEEDSGEMKKDVDDPLVERIERFFATRKIHINFPNDGSSADFFGRALGQKDVDIELKSLARGASEARTKLKRMLMPILIALKLKALIVLPIVITLIGFIGFKGLGAGLIALLISGAVALKGLVTPLPPPRVSYSVVKPYDVHEQWQRSQEEINQPYRGWAPEYNGEQYPYQDIP